MLKFGATLFRGSIFLVIKCNLRYIQKKNMTSKSAKKIKNCNKICTFFFKYTGLSLSR